ncbi:hypothetical protein [Treponema pedis]|uniref:hypothetical protein n=1 Tax=Treponema pedis TaxID=409322 RepID=UPI00041DB351|nr:hypothetical protein [Treponema pedis]
MKRYYVLFFAGLSFFLFSSCKSLPEAASYKPVKSKADNGIKPLPDSAAKEHLTERIWILAGLKMEDNFFGLDANMRTAKINFLPNGEFEATSGISAYYGIWKKRGKTEGNKYNFTIEINSVKTIDTLNTIGKPFDEAFRKNLKDIVLMEIDEAAIKLYSKEGSLLLHFVKI